MEMMSGMQRFIDDDRGYRDWLDDHPDGFVNAKVCGGRDELEDFARDLGGQAQPCGLCLARHGQLAPARPAGGKYGPLREYLSGSAGTRVRMTFAEVEVLVGRLPESAYRHRAWWGNNDGNVEARAWLEAGWRVESVNQAAGEVVFTRAADGRPRDVPVRLPADRATLTSTSAPAWRREPRRPAWIPASSPR